MTEVQKSMALFSGSVNPELADEIAKHLNASLGNVKLEKFANGEIYEMCIRDSPCTARSLAHRGPPCARRASTRPHRRSPAVPAGDGSRSFRRGRARPLGIRCV